MTDPVVTVECEEGYPTDEGLAALRSHAFDPREAAQFLVHDFPAICAGISCCSVRVEDGKTITGAKAHRIAFSTGGWSGAEDLIGTMLSHFWIKHHHSKWQRGGHYEFEVPAGFLDMEPVNRARALLPKEST